MSWRRFDSEKLVVASHNAGKVREINDLLQPFSINVVSAGELDLPEPVEDGDTFIANAKIKALASASASGFPALADDSGMAVTALGGAPGIYSARWAGPEKDFDHAMERVHNALADTMDRSAQFVCALCLAWPDGHTEVFEGTVGGTLVWPGRGNNGFGYDPMFLPHGYDITFGEMDPQAKHAISHRAIAFQKMVGACFAA